MSITVKAYLDTFLAENDHPYSYDVCLKWLNLCESNLDIVKQYLTTYYARTLNAFQFSLPSGVEFEDVTKVYVEGIPYKKKDTRAYKESRSYWYEGSKLCIYPACSITDNSYTSGASEITFASATITTTGDDFTGIAIGDVVTVSGCVLTTTNNKSATVIGVAAKVLTFATGTFGSQLEVAPISISVPKIKMTYLYRPATKLIANIATDTLNLPDRFVQAYDFFLLSKIAYLAKDYGDSQNHSASFNSEVARFGEWYENHRPQSPIYDNVPYSYGEYSETSDFDKDT